ncbi:cytochrome P450 [Thermaurantiacus sp.]
MRLVAALDGVAGLGREFLRARGPFRARLAAVLASPAGQRHAMAVLRFAKPRLTLRTNLVTCYEGEGTLLLTRAADVREVLARDADFEVVYGPRMRALTGGRDFILGLPDGPIYRRDAEALAAIVKPADLAAVLAMARAEARAAIEAGGGRLDLPPALSARIPALMVQRWFGIDGGLPLEQLIADATTLFWFLFSDLGADPRVAAAAMAAKDRIQAAIAASLPDAAPETLLGRAAARGREGDPAFDRAGIHTQFIGLLIGAIPTLSKAACLAVHELLGRPAALAQVRAAAGAGNEEEVGSYIFEALRFAPVAPVIYRRAARPVRLGRLAIPAGRMVLAASLSAMHDEDVGEPAAFRPGRPSETYMLWGAGLHTCWGARINRALLPAMLAPLLAQPGLRQLAPPDGAGSPFPRRYPLAWDAA